MSAEIATIGVTASSEIATSGAPHVAAGASSPRTQVVRQVVGRGALGFVAAWFAFQEFANPAQWAPLVPQLLTSVLPAQALLTVYSSLLVLTAVGITLGIRFRASCWLLAALLALITVPSLLLYGNQTANVVRDVGIVGLAVSMALEPQRIWQLERVLRHR